MYSSSPLLFSSLWLKFHVIKGVDGDLRSGGARILSIACKSEVSSKETTRFGENPRFS